MQVNAIKDKLREKESELTNVFEACELEKSAYESARESADARYQAEQGRKIELESTVRELSVMVEQLKEVCLSIYVSASILLGAERSQHCCDILAATVLGCRRSQARMNTIH